MFTHRRQFDDRQQVHVFSKVHEISSQFSKEEKKTRSFLSMRI